jgi:hypothetical protein
LSIEPIFASSVAAAVTSSGVTITNDMGHLPRVMTDASWRPGIVWPASGHTQI